MAPTDSTPSIKNTGNFELLSSLNAYNKIPVTEYKSTKTGLTVVIAEVDGPVVNGYFCLVTEALDDDGLPHTLEHLIFLGSENYPYKGVLDLLANRCMASGTNAWTDVDHTCYTMETAGTEGFLTLMPIFLDHILYPVLSDEGFVTEVHHITGEGEDAGVVYCEMQGRENSAESRLHLQMARSVYPGKCGYSSETGGIMKNLRETCNNTNVRNYHKEFYRPENLKLIITGQVRPEDVFKALQAVEDKILAKGARGDFTRPWQSTVPPLEKSKELKLRYPSDEEDNGLCSVAWRGPSACTEIYQLSACAILLKYLTDFSVSPLQREFVEIEDPYASKVNYSMCENAESCLYVLFENVPTDKLCAVKPKLDEVFKKIVADEDIDMVMLKNTINKHKLESLSSIENSPHHTVAFMIIGHMLYGNSEKDLEQRVNPLTDLETMLTESKTFWLKLLNKYFLQQPSISICGIPSIEEQRRMASEEKSRIDDQITKLGPDGLATKQTLLDSAIAFNERPAPEEILKSVTIPSIASIKFHEITRYSTAEKADKIDLTQTPVFTYFDHVKTNFVYMFALMDTSSIPSELRCYLPLMLECLFESPVQRGDQLVPYEDVVTALNRDTVATSENLGLGGAGARFKCGVYAQTATVSLQVEAGKYELGVDWLRELLYQTVFTVDRVRIIATKIVNEVAQAKRSGRSVVAYAMKDLCYVDDSNQRANGILRQHKFLTTLLSTLDNPTLASITLAHLTTARNLITAPANLTLYLAGDLDTHAAHITAAKLNDVLPEDVLQLARTTEKRPLHVTPDHVLMVKDQEEHSEGGAGRGCVIGLGCLESSFFVQTTESIKSAQDDDLPALLLYLQYVTQAEGAMWKQVRGKGLAYHYTMMVKPSEGLLYLVFARATNVVGAYREAHTILRGQLDDKVWDLTSIESAKSSLIFEIIDEEKTIGTVVSLSLGSYFQGVDIKHNRKMLGLVDAVTVEDLNRVGEKYIRALLDPGKVRTAIVCDPTKVDEIKAGLEEFKFDLKVYGSLEQSFLNECAV